MAALAVYIIFGINPNCSKVVVPQYMSPEVYTAVRMIFGTAVFWFLSLMPFTFNGHSVRAERVPARDVGVFALGGILLAGTLFAFSEAFRYTSPCYVALVSATSPIFVMLMAALFLKEPISVRKVAGVMVGIGGAMMIVLFSWRIDANATPIGLLLCFINILFYAAYLIFTRGISKQYHPVTMMKWVFLFGSIVCVPFCLPFFSAQSCM